MRLHVCAHALEEPEMRLNLSSVLVLDHEEEVDVGDLIYALQVLGNPFVCLCTLKLVVSQNLCAVDACVEAMG